MVYLLAALAALCNAAASVLERRAAADSAAKDLSGPRLIGYLVRQPAWLGGILAMIGAFVLQAAALDRGRLGVVQPILVVELPITLLIAALVFRRPVVARDWQAALAMSAGLALLLLTGNPGGGTSRPSTYMWMLMLIASGGLLVWLVGIAQAARGGRRAGAYGIAAGTGFGLTAVFMKSATEELGSGLGALFSSWQIYATVGGGVMSLYLLQRALQAGPLSIVQPGVTIVDPIIATVCGVMLFGESLRTGWAIAGEAAGVLALVYGVVMLSRSPLVHEPEARPGTAPESAGDLRTAGRTTGSSARWAG